MEDVLVTGARSGIGHGFVIALANRLPKPRKIYAIDLAFPFLNPAETFASSKVERQWIVDHVQQITADVTDAQAVETLVKELDKDGAGLSIVIHSAGIRGLVPSVAITRSEDVASAETLAVMDEQTLLRTYSVNTIGTFTLLRAIVPFANAESQAPTRVVVMSSRLGSVGNNSTGGAYAYRASKAALNAIVKSFAVDVPSVIWTLVHPGRVESKLVPVREDGAIPVETSVADMMELIESMDIVMSGTFVDRFGVAISW